MKQRFVTDPRIRILETEGVTFRLVMDKVSFECVKNIGQLAKSLQSKMEEKTINSKGCQIKCGSDHNTSSLGS